MRRRHDVHLWTCAVADELGTSRPQVAMCIEELGAERVLEKRCAGGSLSCSGEHRPKETNR